MFLDSRSSTLKMFLNIYLSYNASNLQGDKIGGIITES